VCAGVLRVFGEHLAELPLVATKAEARRKGHCRVFIAAIEDQLHELGVGVFSLPAATAAIPTWINAFNFNYMGLRELQAVQSELRMLMFPGSKVLYKTLGMLSPKGPFAFAGAAAGALVTEQEGQGLLDVPSPSDKHQDDVGIDKRMVPVPEQADRLESEAIFGSIAGVRPPGVESDASKQPEAQMENEVLSVQVNAQECGAAENVVTQGLHPFFTGSGVG
jgi:hypothetical protein